MRPLLRLLVICRVAGRSRAAIPHAYIPLNT